MIPVIRHNVEEFLDQGLLYVGMNNGRWWQLRRNGVTKRWKRDKDRISIPVKAGLKTCVRITETDFKVIAPLHKENDRLSGDEFRHRDDVPKNRRF